MADNVVEVKKSQPPALPDVWQSLRSEMDRMVDRFTSGFGFGGTPFRRMLEPEAMRPFTSSFSMAMPAVDVTESNGSYKIAAELPGMTEKDVEVAVSGDMLTLKGEKRAEKKAEEKNYYLSERSYGAFQRSFYLPEGIARDKIAADFSNGVLTVTLPKTPEAQKQSRKIEIGKSA